jgi:Kef-type K+ transport system membrane component KefB
MNLFIELAVIVVIATVVSLVMRALRQPLVVGYILTGIIVGPYVLNMVQSTEYIELFSKIGIATLLFIVGLNLNPSVIREVGKVSFLTGIAQVVITTLIGYFIIFWLGYDHITSLYVSVALTFSSTIIVLKLLADKGDLQKLYGKISIGFLLVEDLIAVLILLGVSTFAATTAAGAGANPWEAIGYLLANGVLLTVILFLVSKYFLPKASALFASSQELLYIFSLAWGLGMAALFYTFGFSIEIGALIAGVSLALSPFAYEIGARIKPLRDFFIVIFFVLLGSQLAIDGIGLLITPAVILSLFVLIGNPLIVFILMNLLGYKRKTAYMSALTVAQISEFSLILAAMAHGFGHISADAVSLVTLVGIITIAGSTYLILYSETIFPRIEWLLKLLEWRQPKKREQKTDSHSYDMVIFGYDRVGTDFVEAAEKLKGSYVVVDFNPEVIMAMREKNIPHLYGDAEDVEFLSELSFKNVKLVVSTIPDARPNLVLLRAYRKVNPAGIILVMAQTVERAREFYLASATYVIMPHYLGAHHASMMISRHGFDVEEFQKARNLHLQKLLKRKSV